MSGVQDLIRRRRWEDAYERYQELLAAHEGAGYVLDRAGAIEGAPARWTEDGKRQP